MNRPVISNVASDSGFNVETELRPFGSRSGWKQDADLDLLHRRFPTHCPYHLLHNLLQLHFGRHEMCTAAPFSVEMCRHGTHAKPVLSQEQMRATAPAEGALLLLPFGLSCRACDDDVGLVAGCAECESLDDGEACGGCRRVWFGGHPHPATQLPQDGRPVELEGWRRAVGLPGAGGLEGQEEWSDEEEGWGEEEWEEEEEEWEDEEAEYWGCAEDGEEDASWDAEGDGDCYGDDYGSGDDGWQAQGGPAGAGADSWGAGQWVEDGWGSWAWVVDFAAPAAASTVPAAGAPAPDVAAVAAAAAVQAVLAAGAAPAAPGPAAGAASAPSVSKRLRILELKLELKQLKKPRLS